MAMTKENCVFETHGDSSIWTTPLRHILACAQDCAQCKLVIAATDTHAPGWTLKNRADGLIAFYLGISAFVLHENSSKKQVGKFYLLLKPKGPPLAFRA